MTCAPTATRTRDLLLRRHSRSAARHRPAWPDVPFSCSDNSSTWPEAGPAPTVVGSQFGSQESLAPLMFERPDPDSSCDRQSGQRSPAAKPDPATAGGSRAVLPGLARTRGFVTDGEFGGT
jgi:hypothetical protein